jgi:hypothetical protein
MAKIMEETEIIETETGDQPRCFFFWAKPPASIDSDEKRPWFPTWKDHWKALWTFSQGALFLLTKPYRGDERRHQILHHRCGRSFDLSMSELKAIGPEKACPYCNDAADLSMFGSIEAVQQYVIRISYAGAYFYSSNPLGTAGQTYQWYCLRHHRPYATTFTAFLEGRGETNGCPDCGTIAKSS